MLNWFKNNEIDWVRLDERGWKLRDKNSDVKVWDNDSGDVLSLNFFNKPPDIPVSLSQVTELRNFYRKNVAEVGGGVLKIETIEIKGLSAVECLFKMPMQPSGMLYLASFTIPFRDKSYVVKLQCPEKGITGARDSAVFALHTNFDDDDDENFDPFKGWMKDPYDESVTEGVLMNLSEDEQYDVKFPNHPLTRARKYMSQIKETISFDERLFKLACFD
jgi:hypothetical protein